MSISVIIGRSEFEQTLHELGPHTAVAVALSDIDGFGDLNDRYGRDALDRVLRSYERTLQGSLPKKAVIARLGGDEYAMALPDTTAENALILLEEVRSHLAGRPASDDIPSPLQVSIGIAARPPHAAEPDQLYLAAEQAMYRAKRDGGGRVAMYVEEKMVLKSNYYTRAALDRLAKLSSQTGRTEASLLREALDTLLDTYRQA